MHDLLRHITALFTVAVLVFSPGCHLSDPDPGDPLATFALTGQQNLSLTTLSWDKVNVTGFKEYILLHSTQPIPSSPTPEVNQNVTVLHRIDDADITSIGVSPTLLSAQICYRLYCAVDDRFIYTDNLCIDHEIDIVDGFYDRACHEDGLDEIVLFDRINNKLTSLNYKTGTITNSVTDIVLNFPSLEMSTWDNTTNVFGIEQSPAWLRKYNLSNLTATSSKSFNQILWAANVYNQFVFVGTQEFNSGFQVLSRGSLQTIDSRAGTNVNQYIAVFPGSPMTVLSLGSTESRKYLIDDTGMIIGEEFVTARVPQPDQQHSCANGDAIFIGGSNGAVINHEGNTLALLNANPSAFILMSRLSADETKALYLINNNGEMRLQVADLSNLPLISTIGSYEVPSLNYADILEDDEIIYLIGTSFNNLPQTFILRYPLIQ